MAHFPMFVDLKNKNVKDEQEACNTHHDVGQAVRQTIKRIGGTMPEDLPTPEKSNQEIEKEQMERLKLKAKHGKLMLDE